MLESPTSFQKEIKKVKKNNYVPNQIMSIRISIDR
jgi:hypothetical protein